MSDYTPTTDFSDKDDLPSGDSEKTILGSDIDVEFTAIQTAILSKYDSTDIASTGDAATGTSSTKLMTPSTMSNWYDANKVEQYKYKTANEAKTNDATLADDTHLAGWSLDADTWYAIEGCLIVFSAGATPDFQCKFVFDNAAQFNYIGLQTVSDQPAQQGDASADGSAVVIALIGADYHLAYLKGQVQCNASTASTMDFQWAQNTSDATATTLYEGSWIRVTKLGTD